MTAPVALEANAAAFHSPKGPLFVIRPCATVDELDRCIQLQQQTWGYSDLEVVPRNMYVLAQALGGHVLAAWDEHGELAGFAMAIAAHEPTSAQGHPELFDKTHGEKTHAEKTWMRPVAVSPAPDRPVLPAEQAHLEAKADKSPASQARLYQSAPGPAAPPVPYLHSHMLAVAPRYQNCGLGFALKLAQRNEALSRGITCMRWTFDPLMAKNAFFNLSRLGATAGRYIPNFYGRLGSKLQGGLPTDRLLAEWDLGSARVLTAIERRVEAPRRIVDRIPLPAMVAVWKAQGAYAEAEAAQRELRLQMQAAFARGLQIEGFLLAPDRGGEYLLVERPGRASAKSFDGASAKERPGG